jgi:hypothetical protein
VAVPASVPNAAIASSVLFMKGDSGVEQAWRNVVRKVECIVFFRVLCGLAQRDSGRAVHDSRG